MPAVARVRPALHHLQTLDPREVYRGQVFHDAMLWQGHSVGDVSAYRIDAHAADGSLMASAQMPHTVEFLHAFGPRAILAVGKHLHRRCGWRTYHSIVRCVTTAGRAHRLRVITRGMPWHLQVEQFGGGPRAMFFNEPGSSTVIRWGGWRARPLRPDLRFPGTMILRGRHLFVLERNDYRPGRETIARIDLVSEEVERPLGTLPCGIAALVDVPGSPWIAAAEAWADRVLLIEAATSRIAAVLPVPGRPVELAACGRRLAVLSAASQTLWFFDLAAMGRPPVAEWDLAALGPLLEHPRGLDVDPVTKTVFIRTGCHPLLERSVAGVTLAVDPAR
ncbi:MAG: YncE family protein [Planctomycetaceae bacterium]